MTLDIADELRRRFAEYHDVPVSVEELLENAGAKGGEPRNQEARRVETAGSLRSYSRGALGGIRECS